MKPCPHRRPPQRKAAFFLASFAKPFQTVGTLSSSFAMVQRSSSLLARGGKADVVFSPTSDEDDDEPAESTLFALVVIIKGGFARVERDFCLQMFAEARRKADGFENAGREKRARTLRQVIRTAPFERRISHHLTRRRIRTCKKGNASWDLTYY